MKSERLFLTTLRLQLSPSPSDIPAGVICQTSKEILQLFSLVVLGHHSPLAFDRNGNCFYRALSRALHGHEEFHYLIRLLTALEIAEHSDFYDATSRNYQDLVGDVRVFCGDYMDVLTAAVSTVAPENFSETLHGYAASAALGVPLCTYYPASVNS